MKDKILKELKGGSKTFQELSSMFSKYRHRKFVITLQNMLISKEVDRFGSNNYKLHED